MSTRSTPTAHLHVPRNRRLRIVIVDGSDDNTVLWHSKVRISSGRRRVRIDREPSGLLVISVGRDLRMPHEHSVPDSETVGARYALSRPIHGRFRVILTSKSLAVAQKLVHDPPECIVIDGYAPRRESEVHTLHSDRTACLRVGSYSS